MPDINPQLAAIHRIGQEMDVLLRIRDLALFNKRLDEQQQALHEFLQAHPVNTLSAGERMCLGNIQGQLRRHAEELHTYQQEIHQQVKSAQAGKSTVQNYRRISDSPQN